MARSPDHSRRLKRRWETDQYLAALRKLGLTPASKRTAAMLSVSMATLKRWSAGTSEIPGPIVRLLAMYVRHGLPEPE